VAFLFPIRAVPGSVFSPETRYVMRYFWSSAFKKKRKLFTSNLDFIERREWQSSIASYGAETLTLQKVDQKSLERFEM